MKGPRKYARPVRETFQQSLASLKKDRELTVFDLAQIIRAPKRTVESWLGGHAVPDSETQREALRLLNQPEIRPSERTRKRVERSHHLIWDWGKGWELRLTATLTEGKKVTVKRIREKLKTRNLDEAIRRRDLIVADLNQKGMAIMRQRTIKIRFRNCLQMEI